ncbi:hypothetical protein C8J57DRAFT_1495810 [Mycena rebaudengoi]|nr:hypothetical protein C8J57DRAFT_1495810 [Mycena rebaudengoi]
MKCTALTTLRLTRHATPSTTYGSKVFSVDSHPLELLPPPDSVRSYIDDRSHASLRSALYAVRDSFREIVLKTVGTPKSKVMRLADLCSIVVGQNMQVDEVGDEEHSTEIEELPLDDLYDVIPLEYRRPALLAHALSIILCCPPYPTLLSILLDVSLQNDLHYEACLLLRRLLRAAASPVSGPGSVLRLCHSAHSNYLVELFQKWQGYSLCERTFARILAETLVEAARPELWGCRAMTKFTRELYKQDVPSLLHIAGELAGSIAELQAVTNNSQRKLRLPDADDTHPLADHLNSWLSYSISFYPSNSLNWPSIFEFLERCREHRLHRNADSLAATVVCWATHCLSAPMDFPGHGARRCIVSLLNDVSPTVSTYSLLVEQGLGTNQTSVAKLSHCMDALRGHASSLRAEKLLLLEASLWACALRCVEGATSLLGHRNTQKEVQDCKEELMRAVEEAESRCFGSQPSSVESMDSCRTPGPRWKWEEIPGCWVVCGRSPAPKKAKLRHRPRSSIRPLAHNSHHVASPGDIGIEERNGDESYSFELSFRSLVSSALSNRTVLHPPPPVDSSCPKLPPQLSTGRGGQQTYPMERKGLSEFLPSDDALDLFAYPLRA